MWVQSRASASRLGPVRAPCDLIPGAPLRSASLEGPRGPNGPRCSLCHTVNAHPLSNPANAGARLSPTGVWARVVQGRQTLLWGCGDRTRGTRSSTP